MQIEAGPLLKTIDSPDDLKAISREKLHQVCDELRQYIIDLVSQEPEMVEEPMLMADFIRALAMKKAMEKHGIFYDA